MNTKIANVVEKLNDLDFNKLNDLYKEVKLKTPSIGTNIDRENLTIKDLAIWLIENDNLDLLYSNQEFYKKFMANLENYQKLPSVFWYSEILSFLKDLELEDGKIDLKIKKHCK